MDNLERQTTDSDITEDMVEIDLREYFTILWKRKMIIIGLLIVAIIGSLVASSLMTKIYQTSALVMVKEDKGMENLFSEQMGALGSLAGSTSNKLATYTQILKSRSIIQQTIEELELKSKETGELISPQALRNKISISGGQEGSGNLITITVNYSDPVVAKRIANTLVDKFQQMNQAMNQSDLQGAAGFVSKQLKEVKTRLANLEEKLLEYKKEHDVILPEKQGEDLLEKLTKLETAKSKAEVELKQAEAGLKEVRANYNDQDKDIISARTIAQNPMVQKYKEQLSNLEVELTGLKESYTDNHPKVIATNRKIDEVTKRLNETVEEIVRSKTETINPIYQTLKEKVITLQSKIITTKVQIDTHQQQIKELEKELNALPDKALALARLKRKNKIAEKVYTMLRERKEELQIQKAMKTSDIVVIDPAVVGDEPKPIKPKTKLNVAIAIILATFMGVGIIFVLEYLDTTIKEEQDIEELTDLPVLGTIPDFDTVDHSQGYGRDDQDG
ncbi:GumC family protein [Acetohalobium arabaticum]|uniref:Lipopolysaccharide biosynthesis protein n=1 Tax=Acetohalobium arabaticum (strain ATCC 49924 / DSM 5501 / Z-7288) TaxID=574087 RepID=D9QTC7_ACEAZ|nr:Wzz/FepE/Etk N-terminal domain-containing protein [Acetohalobium arabaticum]ADL13627.1 lipopolysaccharide biosynthesis protein [Acetohalobium arabaticum DSM 5501]